MFLVDMVRSRDKGQVIPGWQAGRLRAYRGVLLLEQKHITYLRRYVLVANIKMAEVGEEPPPALWDVRPVAMTVDYWTFTGFERIGDPELTSPTDYAQTWHLVAPRPAVNGYHGNMTI